MTLIRLQMLSAAWLAAVLAQSPTAVYSLGLQQQLFINHHHLCLPRHGCGPGTSDYRLHCTDVSPSTH